MEPPGSGYRRLDGITASVPQTLLALGCERPSRASLAKFRRAAHTQPEQREGLADHITHAHLRIDDEQHEPAQRVEDEGADHRKQRLAKARREEHGEDRTEEEL